MSRAYLSDRVASRTCLVGLTLALLVTTTTRRSRAASPDTAPTAPTRKSDAGAPPHLTFDTSTGIGAPGGLVSVGGALHLSEYAVRGGAGYAWDGPQFYAGLTAHPIELAHNPTARLGLGAFWSTGKYSTGFTTPKHYWRQAHWANLEVSLLIRHAPLEGRVFAGAAIVVNARDGICGNFVNCANQKVPLPWVPYLGFGGSFAVF